INLKGNKKYNLRDYHCFYKNRANCQIASGGVAIFIKDNLVSKQLPVISDLQVVAAKVLYSGQKISIANMYLPPNTEIDQQELRNIVNQIPSPQIILLLVSIPSHPFLTTSRTIYFLSS